MHIQIQGFLARWGFAHLIATNLSMWAYIVMTEAYENILHAKVVGSGYGDDDHHHGDDYGHDKNGTGSYDDHTKHKSTFLLNN